MQWLRTHLTPYLGHALLCVIWKGLEGRGLKNGTGKSGEGSVAWVVWPAGREETEEKKVKDRAGH